MDDARRLHIQMLGYWRAGCGNSAGAFADAVVQKDRHQLPMLGGRHIKGLLRHAVHCAEHWGWFADQALPDGPARSFEELLFGSESHSEARYSTLPGMLAVSDARLPEAELVWLAADAQADLRSGLYDRLSSTAINESGSAKHGSLRTMEVAVPVVLHASIRLSAAATDSELRTQQLQWLQQDSPWLPLEASASLVDRLGAGRSRGLGEATLVLESATGAKS